jgi:hypothetical protein
VSGVAQTSIDAYCSLDLNACAKKLLGVMQPGTAYTDRQLAALCDEECGWIPQRRRDLIAAGLVEYSGEVSSITGRRVMSHRLTARQLELV